METPPVGSLVVPSPSYRETMETGEGAAVLLAILRGSGKLYYAGTDKTFWVPMRQVRPIPPEVLPPECLERFLSDLLLFLDAEACTVEEVGQDAMQLAIEVPAITRNRLEELIAKLASRLEDFELEPRSMRAVLFEMSLVSLPRAAGAGR